MGWRSTADVRPSASLLGHRHFETSSTASLLRPFAWHLQFTISLLRSILPTVNNNVAIRRHSAYQRQMPKTPSVGVRLDPEVKAALEKAAAADARSLSSLIAKIVSEWVRRNGWVRKGRK
jgi:hypothetical protein